MRLTCYRQNLSTAGAVVLRPDLRDAYSSTYFMPYAGAQNTLKNAVAVQNQVKLLHDHKSCITFTDDRVQVGRNCIFALLALQDATLASGPRATDMSKGGDHG